MATTGVPRGNAPIGVATMPVGETALTADTMGTAYGVGKTLYDPGQPWLFPFEMTSILLLIAVVGAVVLAGRRTSDEEAAL